MTEQTRNARECWCGIDHSRAAQALVRNTRRGDLVTDLLGALDKAEEIHRVLLRSTPEQVGLDAASFSAVRRLAETAYLALAKARQVAESST